MTMAVIRRDFFPEDLKPLLQQNGSMVVWQYKPVNQKKKQGFNRTCKTKQFIKGIVGW